MELEESAAIQSPRMIVVSSAQCLFSFNFLLWGHNLMEPSGVAFCYRKITKTPLKHRLYIYIRASALQRHNASRRHSTTDYTTNARFNKKLQHFELSYDFSSMKAIKKALKNIPRPGESDFLQYVWDESWTYIKTVVDIVREPILILDKDLRVMAANDSFYRTFQVEQKDTEGKVVYELGNGQWNIPALRKLLEDILPKHTFFKGFEVSHEFPAVGHKVMILNARQIHFKKGTFPPTIFLAMEDVTDMMAVANALATHTKEFEARLTERTQRVEAQMDSLLKEIDHLKKRP